jgi:hypothetical protein
MAFRGSRLGVADGVEYGAFDQFLYDRADGVGYDPAADYDLDPAVPTMAIALKSTRALQPNNGKMDNPTVKFHQVGHYDYTACVVVGLYIPPDINRATLEADAHRIKCWREHAKDLKGTPRKFYSLKGGKTVASVPVSLAELRKKLERDFDRQKGANGLVPYGERARTFHKDTHRLGQAAIDALNRQVLAPIGATLLPPADGREGGAEDIRIHFKGDDAPKTAQIKLVRLDNGPAGFFANLSRHNGGYRDVASGKKVRTRKPYKVGENDLYVFVRLDDDGNLAKYWCATEAQMVGDDPPVDRLIADADGRGGVMNCLVHPHLEDKARLGDNVPNQLNHDTLAVRTRAWIQSLGPILPPAQADALAAERLAAKRALRTSQRLAALEARVEEVAATAAKAGPSTVNNITNNVTVNNYNPTFVGSRKRPLGDIRGYLT